MPYCSTLYYNTFKFAGPRSFGEIRQITMVQKTDTAEEPTVEVQGRWVFAWCALRSCCGTAMLVHTEGDAAVSHAAIGTMMHCPLAGMSWRIFSPI